jgi:parvulin-like peptidyl-prolyl isomerase
MAEQKKKKQPMTAKQMLVSIIIGFVAVAFVGSFAYNYAAKRGKTVLLAMVNGEPVPVESDSLFANLYRQYYEEERQKNPDTPLTEEKNTELLRRALSAVIQRILILQYAKREGITVEKETVLASVIKKGYYSSPGKTFDEERYNGTPESDRQRVFNSEKEQLVIGLFIDTIVNSVNVSEVETKAFYQFSDYGKKISYVFFRYDDVPEASLKAYYNENPGLFERAHAAHILFKDDEQKAKEVLAQVQADPSKFAEIARKESADPTKDKGGDLGWFYRKDMVPEFSEAAFKLKKDEISPIVKSAFGYHIIKALDDMKVETYEAALPKVKREYVEANREELEKSVAQKSMEFIEKLSVNPAMFESTVGDLGLRATRTDYIRVMGQYVLNEDRNAPLFELMSAQNLVENVFSAKIGQLGGPIKSPDGDIVFKVLEEKKFNEEEYEKAASYLATLYSRVKENNLFNDWYTHAYNNSKIVDNFDRFFAKRPTQRADLADDVF